MKKMIFSMAIALMSFSLFAQTTMPSVGVIKSPEASAIDKMIEVPVSYFTGVPNISIPLYEIKIKGINVPITLDYHAGGIRVDEEATWVGLGWSLGYGGQVSRNVKGKPDEYSWIDNANNGSISLASYLSLPNVHQDEYMTARIQAVKSAKSQTSIQDYMPDEFSFSGLGYSSRFMFNQGTGQFVFFPKEDLKVSLTRGSWKTTGNISGFTPISTWTVTLPNGNTAVCGLEGTSGYDVWGGSYTTNVWMIKSISNTFNESIQYTYHPFSYTLSKSTTDQYSNKDRMLYPTQTSQYNYADANIQSITFPGGTVTFIPGSRLDLPASASSLSEIDVNNTAGQTIRQIKFYYSYFYGNFGYTGRANSNDNLDNKRLRLDYITIGSPGTTEVQTYRFAYNSSTTAPSKSSYAQDFWGYFNGAPNTTWTPKVLNDQVVSANRNVNSQFAQVFSLQSIQYPTGGQTEFIYEGNTAQADAPDWVLSTLGSSSLVPDGASIYFSGYPQNDFDLGGDPTVTTTTLGTGHLLMTKNFTVPANGGITGPNVMGWTCSTTFYTAPAGGTYPGGYDCTGNNIYFTLNQVNADNSLTYINSFSALTCGGTPTYVGSQYLPFSIQPGNYRMTIEIWNNSGVHATSYSTQFAISWLDNNPQAAAQFLNVGGLRIKGINYHDADGTIVKQKSYSYNTPNSTLTSGHLVSWPVFVQNIFTTRNCEGGAINPFTGNPYVCTDIVIFGNSVHPLETTSGSHLGYTNVSEQVLGSTPADNLTTQYTYTWFDPQRTAYYQNIDGGVQETADWQRGKPVSVSYIKNGNPVRREIYLYDPSIYHLPITLNPADYVDELNTDMISNAAVTNYSSATLVPDFYDNMDTGTKNAGVEIYQPAFYTGVDNVNYPNDILDVLQGSNGYYAGATYPYVQTMPYYQRYTGFGKSVGKVTTTWDDNGNSVVETETYSYEKIPTHYQVTRTHKVNSQGDALDNVLTYPTDYASAPYPSMMQRDMIAYPITQTTTKNSVFLNSFATNYLNWSNNIIAPGSVQTQMGSNPVETRFVYSAYDAVGNVLVEQKSTDVPTAFIYGYNNQYTIAQVTNASVADIAYTSFEDNACPGTQGNWAISAASCTADNSVPFGSSAYTLSAGATLQKTGLTSSISYVVSYWSKNGSYTVSGGSSATAGKTINGWTYYQHTVSNAIAVTITGSGEIDDVKLYPSTAQMTTYTYSPLIGITTITDPNNITVYYTYDALNRLATIKDSDGNVMKNYAYHYINGNE
jgi:YD repeat-containing protein